MSIGSGLTEKNVLLARCVIEGRELSSNQIIGRGRGWIARPFTHARLGVSIDILIPSTVLAVACVSK